MKKKVNDKVVAFRKAFKNSEFFQQFSQDKPLPRQKAQIAPPDESPKVERAAIIDFAFKASKSQERERERTPSLPSVLSFGPDIDQGKIAAIQACKEKLNEYIQAIDENRKIDGLKYDDRGRVTTSTGTSPIAVLKFIRDNITDSITKDRAEDLAKAGGHILDPENNALNDLAKALDEPKKSQRLDM